MDDSLLKGFRQVDHALDSFATSARPIVENSNTFSNPGATVVDPCDVNIEVFNAAGDPAAGCVTRTASEYLVCSIVKEPNLGVVVGLGFRDCDAKVAAAQWRPSKRGSRGRGARVLMPELDR